MEILSARQVEKVYSDHNVPVYALNGIDLHISEGSFVAIIGKSGSGKTTLLRVLSGLDRPTAGSVQLEGKDLHSMSEKEQALFRRRRIGFIFQDYSLLPELTAKENIMLPLLLDGKKSGAQRLSMLSEMLGIEQLLTRYPDQLSGGEQQRISIARALIAQPAVIFADEPTGNLDAASGKDVVSLLHASQKALKQTVVLVTHDLDIARTADRIVTLADGRVVSDKAGVMCGGGA